MHDASLPHGHSMNTAHIDESTPPPSVRIPEGVPPYYLACMRWAHRAQAVYMRRAHRGQRLWTDGVRILLYHRVAPDGGRLTIAPAVFRAQMEWLLSAGVKPIALDEALLVIERREPGCHVCVTFDDGYHDNLDYALPVLRDLAIPATIFPITGVTDGAARFYWYDEPWFGEPPPVLRWDELRAIDQERLFSIGAHTRTHPALVKLTDEAAWEEIDGARRHLEEHLGRSVTSFAYPAGIYGQREILMVRKAGYRLALTCEPGVNGPCVDPHALRRTAVYSGDDLKLFEARIAGLLDRPWRVRDAMARASRFVYPRSMEAGQQCES
jgi:peptidoglycan/xylan/chitin deacetylase (PgdA/CDA1 family)